MSYESNYLFMPNTVYSFETLAPAILGSKVERSRCEGVMTAAMALAMGYNIQAQYRSIYPSLPSGTPDSYLTANYYLFSRNSDSSTQVVAGEQRMNKETKFIICDQWVNKDTIVAISSIDLTIEILNIANTDVERVANLLSGAGFTATFKTKLK